MLVGVLMYVHSARRFLAVAGCHAVENSQPADYLAVAAEHHIPAWDSARREAVIHALKICRQRHTPFLVEPLRRRLNKLRTVTQAYKFISRR